MGWRFVRVGTWLGWVGMLICFCWAGLHCDYGWVRDSFLLEVGDLVGLDLYCLEIWLYWAGLSCRFCWV